MSRKIIPDVVSDQDIVSLSKSATVLDAARLMSQRSINAVLIMDGEVLHGVFTARDLARRVVAADRDLDTPLADVMTSNPETIAADAAPVEALRAMFHGGFRHLPVMDGVRVVGLVSRRDLFEEEERIARD
ncbi:MAG: CBS domain-containing protein [Gammaproteobacteria bacterium]|jgi:CBS domain-containing protein